MQPILSKDSAKNRFSEEKENKLSFLSVRFLFKTKKKPNKSPNTFILFVEMHPESSGTGSLHFLKEAFGDAPYNGPFIWKGLPHRWRRIRPCLQGPYQRIPHLGGTGPCRRMAHLSWERWSSCKHWRNMPVHRRGIHNSLEQGCTWSQGMPYCCRQGH